MKQPKALIFDLNGTMIDDMQYHINAWHRMLNELGAGLSPDQVKSHMYGKNTEVLARVFGKGHFTLEQMNGISVEKEKRYQKDYLPHLRLLPGLLEMLETAKDQKILMAIGSAAIPFNIDFVLDNLNIRGYFHAVVSAEDVHSGKPDPETYLKAADIIGVEPSCCLVFEDAPKGVESALHAGMPCVVLSTMHTKEEFSTYANVLAVVTDYTDPFCKSLFQPG